MLILSFNIVNAACLTIYTTFFCNHFHTMNTVFLAMDIWALYQECYNNKHESSRDIENWARMEDCCRAAWCHLGIFRSGENTISWCFILLLYCLDEKVILK
jgi:hypothetical protein